MPLFLFDLIYHEFMRARLAEMRKQLFLIRREVPEVDTDQLDSAADRVTRSTKSATERHAEQCSRCA
jgi:hypothetical protein